MILCKHAGSAHSKGKYISTCLCHLTLSANQSSLQGEEAVESEAMKSRRDPEIVGGNMKALRYQEDRA